LRGLKTTGWDIRVVDQARSDVAESIFRRIILHSEILMQTASRRRLKLGKCG
jgi:hypothetical protein